MAGIEEEEETKDHERMSKVIVRKRCLNRSL